MSDELDPEVAALLADVQVSERPSLGDSNFDSPTIDSASNSTGEAPSLDMSLKTFSPVQKFFNDEGHSFFDDPNYYKAALTGEDQNAQKLHTLLSKFITATDPKDKTVFRQQLTMTYWELLRSVVPKMAYPSLPPSKKYMVRYGAVSPTLFSPEQKDYFSKVIDTNETGEPVYYLDEWFHDIGVGLLTLSATDEAKPQKSSAGAESQKLELASGKVRGKMQNAENQLKTREQERAMVEAELKQKIDFLCDHPPLIGMNGHTSSYSEGQKTAFSEITDRLRSLQRIDKDIQGLINEYKNASEEFHSITQKKMAMGDAGTEVSSAEIITELNTVRQMAKMTAGRQGNQFPIFVKEYCRSIQRTTGFRENVLNTLAWVEERDPYCFVRTHKRSENRIVPYVVLVPSYGDIGFCWEPFDRYNRVTSRGRIVVPMYPRDLQTTVLTAVADLRWQVAKEKASYFWMEEGLTGQYYQWFDAQKIKGDVKDAFIADYILWMTKEAEGMQRLPKEIRGIFWRFMPFPQERKDMLKLRSLVYAELCQKDMNREMSDGY